MIIHLHRDSPVGKWSRMVARVDRSERGEPGRCLMMPLATLHQWLVFVHVLAAMVWVGGLVALSALGTYVLRTGERDAVARFVGSFRVVGPLSSCRLPSSSSSSGSGWSSTATAGASSRRGSGWPWCSWRSPS